jgi:S1-C subfamily serine protease
MTIGHWPDKEALVKRFLICAMMFLFFVGMLAQLACCQDWDTARANTVLKFAEAQEQLETPNTPVDGKCPDCYGTGKRGDGRTVFKCPTCNGTGKIKSGAEPPSVSFSEGPPVESGKVKTTAGIIDPDVYGLWYTAEYCGYCKIFGKKHASNLEVAFQIVDVTDNPQIAADAGVEGLPSFVLCDRDLQTVLARIEGNQTAATVNGLVRIAKDTKRKRKFANEITAPQATVRITGTGEKLISYGSGTILRLNPNERTALVLTCAHLFDDDVTSVVVEATQQNGKKLTGAVVRKNKEIDLAAIIVQNDGSLTISSPDIGTNSRKGRKAVAYGYPKGGTFYTLTTEIVGLSLDEKYEGQNFVLFATDPSTGMSGGGLFVEGTLVGVVSLADRNRKVGFAVRSQEIREFLKGL